jgi:hypothetical protein
MRRMFVDESTGTIQVVEVSKKNGGGMQINISIASASLSKFLHSEVPQETASEH